MIKLISTNQKISVALFLAELPIDESNFGQSKESDK